MEYSCHEQQHMMGGECKCGRYHGPHLQAAGAGRNPDLQSLVLCAQMAFVLLYHFVTDI